VDVKLAVAMAAAVVAVEVVVAVAAAVVAHAVAIEAVARWVEAVAMPVAVAAAWAVVDRVAAAVAGLKILAAVDRAVVAHAAHHEPIVVPIADDAVVAAWPYVDVEDSFPWEGAVPVVLGLGDEAWSQLRVASVAWIQEAVLENACVAADGDEAAAARADDGRPALTSVLAEGEVVVRVQYGLVVDDGVVAAADGQDDGRAAAGPCQWALAWPDDDVVVGDEASQMDDRASSWLAVGVRFAPTFCMP
jgi:hypothetical protein